MDMPSPQGRSMIRVRPQIQFLALSGLLGTAVLTVLATPGYWAMPRVMAPAVLVDLALGLPLLGYLVLVRRDRMSAWRLPALFVAGLLLARWWVPAAHLSLSLGRVVGVVLPAVELGVLAVILFRLRTLAGRYRRERAGTGRADAARAALEEVLGRRLGDAVFTEAAVLGYAVAGWGRPAPGPGPGTFSLHRRDGYGAVLGAVLLVLMVETGALHLLLHLSIPAVAWVATGLSVYSMVWLLGDFHAARLHPCRVTDDGLDLRVGLRWRARVPWSEVEALRTDGPGDAEAPSVTFALFGRADVWIQTREPVTVRGILGIERRVRVLGVRVDQPSGFEAAVRSRLGGWRLDG